LEVRSEDHSHSSHGHSDNDTATANAVVVGAVGDCSTADRTISCERDDDSADVDMADDSALVIGDDDAWDADAQLENAPL
jgi:hypothetical protein